MFRAGRSLPLQFKANTSLTDMLVYLLICQLIKSLTVLNVVVIISATIGDEPTFTFLHWHSD